jgi:uncharacterized protein with NAD-binding domain and iron-sulfur cluster
MKVIKTRDKFDNYVDTISRSDGTSHFHPLGQAATFDASLSSRFVDLQRTTKDGAPQYTHSHHGARVSPMKSFLSLRRLSLELALVAIFICFLSATSFSSGFTLPSHITRHASHQYKCYRSRVQPPSFAKQVDIGDGKDTSSSNQSVPTKKIVIVGAGWGGLSAAHALATSTSSSSSQQQPLEITLVDAAPRVGGLVRDGFQTINSTISSADAEAGQHGFWDNYHNIFHFLETLPTLGSLDDVLTGYAEQGQYSPNGLEAVWPIYRESKPQLPTGLAQALYTRFMNLPAIDRASAAPLVLAFSDFDDSVEAWKRYDSISFRDLCIKLGVSKRCYDEAFEPMILTGLFAPGAECSAAAALGMAYFFVLKSQNSFDVRWCRGNIGKVIFDPWVDYLKERGVIFLTSTRVQGFELGESTRVSKAICSKVASDGVTVETITLAADVVVFATGGAALNGIVRNSPDLAQYSEFRRFANLRGTGVLATRLFLDTVLDTPYSANACWGFDKGVGMTFFDINKLHGKDTDAEKSGVGSIIEIDYYHAAALLVMSDESIVQKAKNDLDTILGSQSINAKVVDAAIVRLPQAVNWYSPGSYDNMPDVQSTSIPNILFCGDIVRSRHGSWSQEKAFVSGIEAANKILERSDGSGIIPLSADEPHVALGRSALTLAKMVAGFGDASRAPSLVDFLW